jgi:hypothetical protein
MIGCYRFQVKTEHSEKQMFETWKLIVTLVESKIIF